MSTQPTPAPPSTAPPPALDPAIDQKPTGAFSRKTVGLVLTAVCTAVFAYLLFASDQPKKKKAALQQDAAQAQSVARTAATTATQTSDRNYSATISRSLSKDALQAEENVRKFGTGAAVPLSNTSSPASHTMLGTPLDQDLQQDDFSRDTSRNRRNSPPDPQAQLRDTIAADMQKREAAAFFAPLVVISRRPPDTTTTAVSTPAPHASQALADPAPPVPVTQPITPSSTSVPPFAQAPPQLASAAKAPAAAARSTRPDRSLTQNSLNNATGPAHKLFEGTSLDTVLTNRLNGTYSGPVNCMLTTDVWSHNRQTLLIPRGTRILGEARKVDGRGQSRLAVSFHRLIMPDGLSISLDTFVGMNQIGETGLKDKVDNHYRQIFGVSIALGAIAGFTMRGSNSSATQSGSDTWRQGFSQSLSQEATQILDRFLNILPTITIREGTRVKVYLTDDLMLPAYEGHRMSSDL